MPPKKTAVRKSLRHSKASPAAPRTLVRLGDPAARPAVEKAVKRIVANKQSALQFLVDIGISTPTGRLTKNYR